jgi:hypothetical protein
MSVVHNCGGRSYVPLGLFVEILGAQRGSEVLAAAEMSPASRSPRHDRLIDMMVEEVQSHLPPDSFRPRDLYPWLEQRLDCPEGLRRHDINLSLCKEAGRRSPRIRRVDHGLYALAQEH